MPILELFILFLFIRKKNCPEISLLFEFYLVSIKDLTEKKRWTQIESCDTQMDLLLRKSVLWQTVRQCCKKKKKILKSFILQKLAEILSICWLYRQIKKLKIIEYHNLVLIDALWINWRVMDFKGGIGGTHS